MLMFDSDDDNEAVKKVAPNNNIDQEY